MIPKKEEKKSCPKRGTIYSGNTKLNSVPARRSLQNFSSSISEKYSRGTICNYLMQMEWNEENRHEQWPRKYLLSFRVN